LNQLSLAAPLLLLMISNILVYFASVTCPY